LVLIADRKACEEGWVLLVCINHKGQILPVSLRERATEVDFVVSECEDGGSLGEMYPDGMNSGEEVYVHEGSGWD
jgi:hypothetical protein